MQYCAGCITALDEQGRCGSCTWDDGAQPETHNHLPRHYLLMDRYYIGRPLGQGGFGVTYLARDTRLNRLVAIKEYLPMDQCSRRADRATVHSLTSDKQDAFRYGLATFLNEARNVAQLAGHPNIVTVTDYSEANGTAYMIMEYIPGVTLKQFLLDRGGRIPYPMASEILMHVMSGLARTHEAGLIHRDVSPDNILLSTHGPIKLIDFGAARQAVGERSQNLTTILKPGYAPEEQYRTKGQQGAWTDVYATSATLYRCITGKVPPAAPDRLACDELERPASLCGDIPDRAEAALLMGLTVHAAGRFQNIKALREAMLAPPGSAAGGPQREPITEPVFSRPERIVTGPGPSQQKAGDYSNIGATPAPPPPIPGDTPPAALFGPLAVVLTTIFGSALAGTLLLAINFKRLGESRAAWKILCMGLAVVLIPMAILIFYPSATWLSFVVLGINVFGIPPLAREARIVKEKAIAAKRTTPGLRRSAWASVGLVALTWVCIFGVAITLGITKVAVGRATAPEQAELSNTGEISFPAYPGGSVAVGRDKVSFFNPATHADAQAVADTLRTSGFFLNKGVVVDVTRAGISPVIRFKLLANKWDDPAIVQEFEELGRRLGPPLGGAPVRIVLTDLSLEVEKTLTVPSSGQAEIR